MQEAADQGVVRTVTGDIPAAALGRTDYHEHLLMRSMLLRGDELTDLDRSAAETAELARAGIDAVVELTPIGLGRDPQGVRAIAARTGVHVVLATGIHRQAHYPPEHWVHRTDPSVLVELFVRDLTEGCDGADYGGPLPEPTDVRAGVMKVGTGYWSVSGLEREVLLAAAAAHRRVPAAIVCHLEHGTAAWEVCTLLSDAGVPPERIVLAHVDRNPDPLLHADLARSGVYLGYDGAGRAKYWPDAALIDCLTQVVELAGPDRLLLGGDVARRSSFRSHGGLPGMAYLAEQFIPRVRAAVGDEATDRILIDNPARLLTLPASGSR